MGKSKVMPFNASEEPVPFTLRLNGKELKKAKEFKYLRSTVLECEKMKENVTHRLSNRVKMMGYQGRLWIARGLSLDVTALMLKSIVVICGER